MTAAGEDRAVRRPGALRPLRPLLGAVAANAAIRKAVVSVPIVRDLAWRFVAGEDLEDGLAAARSLSARGIESTLSLVGSHIRDEAEAIAAAQAVLAAIDAIAAGPVRPTVSLKLTLIGLDVDRGLCRRLLQRILDRAAEMGVFVRIDMEESPYVEPTLALFEEALAAHGPARVGIVLQSYLRHRRGDVARLAASGASIRLVRGGYWESPDVVLKDRAELDRAFFADIETLVREGVRPAIATHDERAIEVAKRAIAASGRPRDEIEFQMLLGVRGDLAEALAAEGWRVRCYVPYGGRWQAYAIGCVRRLPAGALAALSARLRGPGTRPRQAPPAAAAPAASVPSGPGRRTGLALKRLMDVAGALTGLLVLSPLLAWIALGVAATMGLPVLFRQRRPGLGGRPITVAKFRTMRAPRPGERWFTSDADRVTRLGRFLRASGLDELPELWSVLRGEMSLVGPRPLLTAYLPHYTDRERLRHAMRPGVTGWAAVNGRHTLGFEDRLELDAWYVEHWSLALDIRILLLTVRQLIAREGARGTQDLDEIGFPDRFRAALEASPDNDPEGAASA